MSPFLRMICRCQGASFVSSYPRVLSFSDCSFSFSSSSRFCFSCSFLLGSGGHRALWSLEPPCPRTRPGKVSRHSPFLLPAKAKGRAGLAEPWGQLAGAAAPRPGSPLLLQLLAQDVPPPGWHAGQARLLLLLLQQTAVLAAPPGACPRHRLCRQRHHPSVLAPRPAGGQAALCAQHAAGGARRCVACWYMAPQHRPPSAGAGRRKECAARPALRSTSQLYCTDTRGPHRPGTANATPEGSAAPALRPPAQHTATASGTPQPRPGATQTKTEPFTELSRAAALPEPQWRLRNPDTGSRCPGCPRAGPGQPHATPLALPAPSC